MHFSLFLYLCSCLFYMSIKANLHELSWIHSLSGIFHSPMKLSNSTNFFSFFDLSTHFLNSTFLVFNWNHFEMRLLNLRINFFIYCGLFVLILVVFVLFLLSQRFGQISPLAFFRWFLPQPRIGMLSLVTVSWVITAFHSCCLSNDLNWALSEDSGFKSYPEVYLGYSYNTQHSYPRSW